MAKIQRFQDDILRQLMGAALHHDHRFTAAGHDDVKVTVLHLILVRVAHQLPVNPPHPDAGNGPGKGDVGNHQGCRGTGQGQDGRIMPAVHGNNRGDNLGL